MTIDLERVALAEFAAGKGIDGQMRQVLEARGWILSIPAITDAGRGVLEDDDAIPHGRLGKEES